MNTTERRMNVVSWALLIVATLIAATGPGTAHAGETLERVRQSGELRCGVIEYGAGLSTVDSNGRWTGFWADMCRAVAAAAVGDAEGVHFVPLANNTRFAALGGKAIDLLSESTTWTLGREAGTGLSFTGTMLYDGQGFLAHADGRRGELKSLGPTTVCVADATTTMRNLQDAIRTYPNLKPVVFITLSAANENFHLRKCDLLTSDRTALGSARLSSGLSPDRYVLLPEVISKEPLSPVVRSDDPDWFNVVRWTHFAMIAAEEKGITTANLDSFLGSNDPEVRRLLGVEGTLGESLGLDRDWAQRVIRMVGNYGEVYDRNLGPHTPMALERGMNALWSKGGLIYAPPLR